MKASPGASALGEAFFVCAADMLRNMSDLTTLLPITATVAITLFTVKELLEWRRRAATDKRKLLAIKKVLARDVELSYGAMSDLSELLTQIQKKKLDEKASELSVTSHPAGGFVVMFRGSGYIQRGIRRENFLKHLVDVASLDESFYNHCETAVDGLSEAEHVLLSLVHGPDRHFPSTPKNYYEGLADYGSDVLTASTEALKTFYQACTGTELKQGRIR